MTTKPIRFTEKALHDPGASMAREWLETNGLGGYASSTIIGCNTRKYHGLLVSPAPKSEQRFVFLSRIETVLVTESGEHKLSTNQYPGTLYPDGYKSAAEFTLDTFPSTRFKTTDAELEYSILMRFEQPMVLLRYRLAVADAPAHLRLQPLLAFRDFNATASENGVADLGAKKARGSISVTPYEGLPSLFFSGSAGIDFKPQPDWFRNNEYLREMERGYDFKEDLFTPGSFTVELKPGKEFVLSVSIGKPAEKPDAALKSEIERRRIEYAESPDPLWRGADHFIITKKREGKASIIAGFPWFGEWGRDAMISLPGLTLSRGKPEIARDILESFASFEKNGLFPNQLNVYGGSGYNTVDASLWFFWAAQKYVEYTHAPEQLEGPVLAAMKNILKAYITGKVPYGTVRDDGLLDVGTANTQLTWMDAQINGAPVTPRFGRPVEINALWLNALHFYSRMTDNTFKRELAPLKSLLKDLPAAFLEAFWLEDYGYLADVVYPDNIRDASIRPNQIFAVSLPFSALDDDKAKRVVDTVERHLLTSCGLRTLSPNNSHYHGRYAGNQNSRDSAYHQGTAWPWLIGHFVEAYMRVYGSEREKVAALEKRLDPLFTHHVSAAGLGSISEVFDGEPPHTPGGCPMQAWSVAEVIRSAILLKTEDDNGSNLTSILHPGITEHDAVNGGRNPAGRGRPALK